MNPEQVVFQAPAAHVQGIFRFVRPKYEPGIPGIIQIDAARLAWEPIRSGANALFVRTKGANSLSIAGKSIWSYQITIKGMFDDLTIELRDGKTVRFAIRHQFSQDFNAALSRLLNCT
jgi:hypothetical protein